MSAPTVIDFEERFPELIPEGGLSAEQIAWITRQLNFRYNNFGKAACSDDIKCELALLAVAHSFYLQLQKQNDGASSGRRRTTARQAGDWSKTFADSSTSIVNSLRPWDKYWGTTQYGLEYIQLRDSCRPGPFTTATCNPYGR